MTTKNHKSGSLEPRDVVIIGAGLFGSIIGAWLARAGHSITIYDAEEPQWGSGPAACLMRPSWLGKLSGKELNRALSVLNQLYGLRALIAQLPLGRTAQLSWVPPDAILGDKTRYIKARVISVVGTPWPQYLLEGGAVGSAKTIIVAAGVWCKALVGTPVTAQAGYAFTWDLPTARPDVKIRPWAPYKQLLSFMITPQKLWAGDGSALKPESWTEERRMASLKRCSDFVGLQGFATQHYGLRPYVKGLAAPALVEQVAPGLWVATGGAKNGTAGAAWAAHQLERILS